MTFAAMVAAIQLELNDYSSRTKTNIEKWVNECHKMICHLRSWNFLVVRKSDDMTVGSADVPFDITTDIEVSSSAVAAKSILAIWDITDDSFWEVKHTTQEILRNTYQSEYTGATPPMFWYFINDTEIEFFPTLSSDRVFRFSFKKLVTTYTSGSTAALLIPDSYTEVLQEAALAKAYRFKSDDRAAAARESYKELLASMIAQESAKIGVLDSEPAFYKSRFPLTVDVP